MLRDKGLRSRTRIRGNKSELEMEVVMSRRKWLREEEKGKV